MLIAILLIAWLFAGIPVALLFGRAVRRSSSPTLESRLAPYHGAVPAQRVSRERVSA